jgi:hypothetical protein
MDESDDRTDPADRRAFLLALGAAGVTGLAGCGGDDDGTPSDTSTGTTAPDETTAPGETTAPDETTAPGETDTTTEPATETGTPVEDFGGDPAPVLSVSGGGVTSPDSTVTLDGTLENPYLFDLHAIEVSVEAPEGWSVSPADPLTVDSIAVGGLQEVSWDVSVPSDADGESTVSMEVHYESATDTADVTVEQSIRVFTGDVPIEGLLAHYPLDGDPPTDAVGDNDATINGDPGTDATGQFGGAYDFDGDGDFLTYPALDVSYGGSADWTTSLWVNADTLPSDEDYFIWHPRAQKDVFIRVATETGEIIYTNWTGQDNDLQSGVTLPTEEWVHVCVVSDTDADDQYRMFIDGTEEGASDLPDPNDVGDSNLIGGQNAPALDMRYTDGRIDQVRFYDRALSASEVAALAGGGSE